MLKLTYIKTLWKYKSSIASTACHFEALSSYAPKLKFDNPFWISDYTINCLRNESYEVKQLKFAPQLDKSSSFEKCKSVTSPGCVNYIGY